MRKIPLLLLALLIPLAVGCDKKNNLALPSTPNYSFQFAFGSQGAGNGQFGTYPYGIAYYNGYIFVADFANARIEKFDPNGYYLASYTGGGGGLVGPEGVAFSDQGLMFVADEGADSIQVLDQNGNFIRKFGTTGSGLGQFLHPIAVAADANYVYVVETGNDRLQRCDHTGADCVTVGGAGSGPGQFEQPFGVALDTSGNPWVSDQNNNRVQKFSPDLAYKSQIGTAQGLTGTPGGLAFDPWGNLWVVDGGADSLDEFSTSGKLITSFSLSPMTNPWDLAMDADGNPYVGDFDASSIFKFGT